MKKSGALHIFSAMALAPISAIYSAVVGVRHWMFDRGLLQSRRYPIPTICVGNITVGGSGKTPMCELLIKSLANQEEIALLSRGYGRKSRGYIEVDSDADYHEVGDEPLQMKRKFPNALVVVCEKRATAIERIIKQYPQIKYIIMDDGFQHRYVEPWVKVIMVDSTQPIATDKMLPWGRLRDNRSALMRGDIFIVTKCDRNRQYHSTLDGVTLPKNGSKYYTAIENLALQPLYNSSQAPTTKEVIALAGIGNPTPFIKMLESHYTLVDQLIYGDHNSYGAEDIAAITAIMEQHPQAIVVMTEKDSVKFIHTDSLPKELRERLYYSPIKMHFLESGEQELICDIKQRVERYDREN